MNSSSKNFLIGVLNNKETRYIYLSSFITIDIPFELIEQQIKELPSIIKSVEEIDEINDKEQVLKTLRDALEIRKRDYEEIKKQNLVDWRDNNGDTN